MEIFTVDAFTNKPFGGNPAAVCVTRSGQPSLEPAIMQKIAAEMNLSETAFVSTLTPGEDVTSSSVFSLKWFTPKCEVSLCGHATLATAAVIFQSLKNPHSQLTFHTLSGELKAVRSDSDTKIYLDLPLAETEPQDKEEILGLIKLTVGDLPFIDCQYSVQTRKLLIRLSDEVTCSQLQGINPNTDAMITAHNGKIRGVIVTLKSNDEYYDFFSRYFAPWVGIPEDPVTGSAHTVLGPYWSKQLNKKTMNARQCSPRGGDMIVTVEDDRVLLAGSACIVMHGQLYL